MRRSLPSAVALAVAAAACMPPSHPFSDADRAAVRASVDTFTARVLRADWTAAAGMYAADAHFLPPNQPAVVGRAAIEKWMKAFPPVKAFKVTVDTISGSGDLVYTTGHYTMSVQPAGARAPMNDAGKFLEVHARQADGSWLNVADMFNSDNPAMPMAPAKAPAKKRRGK
ncbi:MAG TPA: nuclear transport factor 2 family protein [Gemmatimonadales bacterium]